MLDAECAWMRQITEAALGPASAKFRGRLVNNQMPVSVAFKVCQDCRVLMLNCCISPWNTCLVCVTGAHE